MKTDDKKYNYYNFISNKINDKNPDIPIYRGCPNFGSQCYCTGKCREVIAYRKPLTGENQDRINIFDPL